MYLHKSTISKNFLNYEYNLFNKIYMFIFFKQEDNKYYVFW